MASSILGAKIRSRKEMSDISASLRTKGKKIGVTNGAFDILHAGHVTYLEKARALCDVLIVSINTDESVKLYKGAERPINTQDDRAKVVAALGSVDYVTFHGERRMRDTLLALKPHFYIKGGDYDEKSLTSSDVLKEWGGEVRFIPLVPGQSTSKIIEKIVSLWTQRT